MNFTESPIESAFQYAHQTPPKKNQGGELIFVAHESEMEEGKSKIFSRGTVSIGVFRLQDEFYAIQNYCPHQGAELCRGKIHGTHAPSAVGTFNPDLQGRVLRCPWHGWEFDVRTGKGLYDAKGRVRTYAVHRDPDGKIYVELPQNRDQK
jgi:nitrite reductase/ring-hydroxylating ferredoxin subunit